MSAFRSLLALALLAACGGAAVDAPLDVAAPAPAVLTGGIVDPLPAETPASHDLELSDGTTTYRVMFGTVRSGAAIADRITQVTGATIRASVDADGRLLLGTVETGPDAEIRIVRGAALPMLGFERGMSATGF